MTLNEEINKQDSERVDYVRINPRRSVNDSFVFVSGDIFKIENLGLIPNQVTMNNTALTQVDSFADLIADNQWAWDEKTDELRIKSISSPLVATNYYNVDYYLFFTDGFYREMNEDPDDSNSTVRLWKPTLRNSPSNSQSIKNVLTGQLSISGTTVNIDNSDDSLNKYFTVNDSQKDSPVDLWVSVNSELLHTYQGKISGVTFSNNQASFTVYDQFSGLRNEAFMGDNASESYLLREAGSFPSVDPNKQGRPIPYVINRSRYAWKNNNGITGLLTGTGVPFNCYTIDPDTCNEAVNVDYGFQSVVNNRQWSLCRLDGFHRDVGMSSSTFSAITVFTTAEYGYIGSSHATFDLTFTSSKVLEVGDTFLITRAVNPFVGSHNCIVTNVVGNLCTCMMEGVPRPASNTNINDANTTFSWGKAPAIAIVQNGQTFFPFYGRDFSLIQNLTSGSNRHLILNFYNDFEANHGMQPLDPDNDKVVYRVSSKYDTETTHRHNEVVQKLVETSGLEIDAASFAQAWTDLNAGCQFQIPYFDETDFSENLKYLQDIFKSALSYISIGTDFKVYYKLFSAPVGTNTTDENEKLLKADSISIDYEDIVTQLIAYNPHVYYTETNQTEFSSSTTLENDKAKYLHNISKTKRTRHLLADISLRLQAIFDLRSNKRATYRYSVATKDWDKSLGDDITMDSTRILGTDTTKELKIVGLRKSTKQIKVELSDLEGI